MSFRRIAAASLAIAALATVAAPSVNAATAKKKTADKAAAAGPALTGPAAAGKKVFDTQCSICHSVAPGAGGVVGPQLNGVVGRKVATIDGFNYTKAMKSKSHVWTAGNLEIYLTDPQKFVPGTAMPINVPAAKDRSDVIAYLSTTKP